MAYSRGGAFCGWRLDSGKSDLGVAVRCGRGQLREDIPVLDDLAVGIEAEDVNALAARRPVRRHGAGELRVRDHEVAVGEDAPDVDVRVGERAVTTRKRAARAVSAQRAALTR